MKSRLPKVLHPVGGKTDGGAGTGDGKGRGVEETAVIIGFGGEEVRVALGDAYHYVAGGAARYGACGAAGGRCLMRGGDGAGHLRRYAAAGYGDDPVAV